MEFQKALDPEIILKEKVGLPYGAKVADLGCGTQAFFSLAAAKLVGDQGQVYACDIIKEILTGVEAKAHVEGLYNIKTVWTNLEIYGATKIDQLVDYCFLTTTLFQTTKHVEMLKEAYRLLKPEGYLLIVEWKPTTGPIGPAPEMRVDKERITSLAIEIGFEKEKDFEAGENHYGLLFKKKN